MTDSGRGTSCRGESVTFTPKPKAEFRRVYVWDPLPKLNPTRLSLAHHEAGHVVFLEWMGLGCQSAEIGPSGGLTHFPKRNSEAPKPAPDPSGVNTATGAALFHAGVVAELLHQGHTLRHGPVRYRADDFQRAEMMLAEVFGAHRSGAHFYAQKFAEHVLKSRWARVQEVAQHLDENGWVGRSKIEV